MKPQTHTDFSLANVRFIDQPFAFRCASGHKALILADLRQHIAGGDPLGFHYVGGYVDGGEFYECRWNEQGKSDRTNGLGDLIDIFDIWGAL